MMLYQLLAGRFPYWPSMNALYTTSLEEVRPSSNYLVEYVLIATGAALRTVTV